MTCRVEGMQTFVQTYNVENGQPPHEVTGMSGVTLVSGDCTTPGETLKSWTFVYDGDGVKVKQIVTEGESVLTTYYYAGGSGLCTPERTLREGEYEVQTDGTTETIKQYYSLAGMTVALRVGDDWSYFLTDHLVAIYAPPSRAAARGGSVVEVTDADGVLTSEARYMPSRTVRPRAGFASGFGEIRTDVGTISETDFGYTFQRVVADSGLMDYKARSYDPWLGRFIQPDTIVPRAANPQAWNRFGYVGNNPINAIDPSGNMPVEGCGDDGKFKCLSPQQERVEVWKRVVQDSHEKCLAGVTLYCSPIEKSLKEMIALEDRIIEDFEIELAKPKYEIILANKYTPVITSAISVVFSDASYLALTFLPIKLKPPAFAVTYLVARAASTISLFSTGYQYKHDLYGTTKEDAIIAAATTAIGSIPKPDMIVANHIGFIYTFLRTFGVINSP